jgi:hypothetical protein
MSIGDHADASLDSAGAVGGHCPEELTADLGASECFKESSERRAGSASRPGTRHA